MTRRTLTLRQTASNAMNYFGRSAVSDPNILSRQSKPASLRSRSSALRIVHTGDETLVSQCHTSTASRSGSRVGPKDSAPCVVQ